MTKTALFIRHQAEPGRRDDVQRIWEKHVKPRVEANLAHEAYFYCYDNSDPDVICVFQLYSDLASSQAFMTGPWYGEYLSEVSQFLAAQPEIAPAALIWAKGFNVQNSLE